MTLRAQCRCSSPGNHSEQVLQGASVLLARLVAWEQAQQARGPPSRCACCTKRQHQSVVPTTELRVALAAPVLDVGHPAGGAVQVGWRRAAPAVDAVLPLHRRAWLLPEPMPLSERDALRWFEGRPLQLLSGPERIEAGRWDGKPTLRDYFIAQAADGALVWVYCARLPQAGSAGSGAAGLGGDSPWFLQGRFG